LPDAYTSSIAKRILNQVLSGRCGAADPRRRWRQRGWC